MTKTWPKDQIRELIALANVSGSAKAKLSSPGEAKLFRFAIYNFRRRQGLGEDLVIDLTGDEVTLTKAEIPTITIISPGTPSCLT